MNDGKPAVPQHVGIIMDGNRRWARARGLATLQGHRKGYDQALQIAEHAFDTGIRYLTLYAFSTENWNRSEKEVAYLMRLIRRMIVTQSKVLHKRNIRLMIIGSEKRVSKELLREIRNAERLTRANTAGTLLIAFNYGGRQEMIDAVESLIRDRKRSRRISPDVFASYLTTAGIPDPDLIIRTSGEQRLSGFLLWQSAYSELYFTRVHWPAFTPREFDKAIREYSRRKRRFGA